MSAMMLDLFVAALVLGVAACFGTITIATIAMVMAITRRK
jgi:hypothetical protein